MYEAVCGSVPGCEFGGVKGVGEIAAIEKKWRRIARMCMCGSYEGNGMVARVMVYDTTYEQLCCYMSNVQNKSLLHSDASREWDHYASE